MKSAFMLLPILAASNLYAASFPPIVTLDNTSEGVLFSSLNYSVDAIAIDPQILSDIDGDARPDIILRTDDTYPDTCGRALLIPSTLSTDTVFNSDSLNSLVQIINLDLLPSHNESPCGATNELAEIGDVNGDGIADLGLYVNRPDFGTDTYVFYGSTTAGKLIDASALAVTDGFIIRDVGFGSSPGDLNGDGFADLAFSDVTDASIFRTFIVPGRADFPLEQTFAELIQGEVLISLDSEALNFPNLTPIGDINGDDIDDVLFRVGGTGVRILYGDTALSVTSENVLTTAGPILLESCEYSCEISAAGDFDADGFNDLLIVERAQGAFQYTSAILYGDTKGIEPAADLDSVPQNLKSLIVTETSEYTPVSLNAVADFNGDGASDIQILWSEGYQILFGTPDERFERRSRDELDGINGFNLATDSFSSADQIVTADINGDGSDDIIKGSTVLLGQAALTEDSSPRTLVLRRAPSTFDLFWQPPLSTEVVDSYRIIFDGIVVDEIAGNRTQYEMNNRFTTESGLLSVQAIYSNGQVSPAAMRNVFLFPDDFKLEVNVYGSRLLELIWDSSPAPFLIWRDGQVFARVNGNSFIDDTVVPSDQHDYYVTPDYLYDDQLSTEALEHWPAIQQRTNTVQATTPAEPDTIGPEPSAPTNLTGTVYSSTALELFWTRATGEYIVVGYDIYQDGTLIKMVEGNSYFTAALSPSVTYNYQVVTVDILGNESSPTSVVSLTTLPGVPTTSPVTGLTGAVYSSTALELFWDRQSQLGTQYIITRDDLEISRTDGTSYFDSGLDPAATYRYKVITVAPDGTQSVESEELVLQTRAM